MSILHVMKGRQMFKPRKSKDPDLAAPEKKKKPKNKKTRTFVSELMYLVSKVCIIVVIIAVLFTFVFGLYRVNDNTMTPNVKDGDLLLTYRIDKEYAVNDIIIVKINGKNEVRRVVAVAGDKVNITKAGLQVNGTHIVEENITESTYQLNAGEKHVIFPLTVPKGEVFVLGDARQHTDDSRIYGCVSIADVTKGTAITVLRHRGL